MSTNLDQSGRTQPGATQASSKEIRCCVTFHFRSRSSREISSTLANWDPSQSHWRIQAVHFVTLDLFSCQNPGYSDINKSLIKSNWTSKKWCDNYVSNKMNGSVLISVAPVVGQTMRVRKEKAKRVNGLRTANR